MVKIGSGTAKILMTLSFWWWWCKVIFVSNPTFELSWGWVGVVTNRSKTWWNAPAWTNIIGTESQNCLYWNYRTAPFIDYQDNIESLLSSMLTNYSVKFQKIKWCNDARDDHKPILIYYPVQFWKNTQYNIERFFTNYLVQSW